MFNRNGLVDLLFCHSTDSATLVHHQAPLIYTIRTAPHVQQHFFLATLAHRPASVPCSKSFDAPSSDAAVIQQPHCLMATVTPVWSYLVLLSNTYHLSSPSSGF
jgi:hypothetical protein